MGPRSLVFKRHDPNIPLTVTGVIRLADKYLVKPLHRRLVQEVCEAWPATLVGYDIKQAEIDSMSALPLDAPQKYQGRLADVIPEPHLPSCSPKRSTAHKSFPPRSTRSPSSRSLTTAAPTRASTTNPSPSGIFLGAIT